ncbi:MAG TPA: TonB-dependent receptor plug domain-containing protein, partial [Opitutaceae bacterium]|nr:TonB-dependent receptor plug domain-containing protein [Opitutaceae bacterium]
MSADAFFLRLFAVWRRLCFAVVLCGGLWLELEAAASVRHAFDIPAGEAVGALRAFAQQSGLPVLYSGSAVGGIRTAAVRGRYTARDALQRMVANTPLVVVEDPVTGGLAISPPNSTSPTPSPSQEKADPMKKRSVLSGLAATLHFSLAASLPGQATPGTPRSASSMSDEVVQLSVFQVQSEREHGYRAASSVTATGIGTAIANIPVNVGVVTEDFIQDWGGVELRDATKGVSGFNSDSQNSNRVWLRGFESSRILQDGFEIGYGMMTDGVDRIEVIKGPSAIFHGEVNPAGVVNLISSRPTWTPQHKLRLTYGSYDHARAYFQTSGPLIKDKLAYMAFTSYTDEGGWADFMMRRIKIFGGAVTWAPIAKLKFTVDARRIDKTRIEPALLPFTHPAFLAAVQAGQVAPLTTARNWLNANPLYGANEPQNVILVDHLVFNSRESNPFNQNYPQVEHRQTVQAEMTYQHSEAVNFRLAAFDNQGERTNGFFTSFRPVAGYNRDLIFAAAEHRFNYSYSEQERSGLKADLNLNFNLLGMNHAMLVGYERGERQTGTISINTTARVYNPRTEPARNALAELRAANPNWFPAIP